MLKNSQDSWDLDQTPSQNPYQGTFQLGDRDFGLEREETYNPKQHRKEEKKLKKDQKKAEKERKRLEKQQKRNAKPQKTGLFRRKKQQELQDLSFNVGSSEVQSQQTPGNLSQIMDLTAQKDQENLILAHEEEIQRRRESLFRKKKKNKETQNTQNNPYTKNQERAMRQMYGVEQQDGYDPGAMIEREEENGGGFGIFVGLVVLISILALGLFGYIETDFDENGESHFITMERRLERRYVKQSDQLLQEIIDSVTYIENDTADMSDYVNKSSEMKTQNSRLKGRTDKLGKYINVPESMQSYHEKLLNVSLGVQQLQNDILANSQAKDYLDWRRYSISQVDADMEALHEMRQQIDLRIWSYE